MLIQTLPAAVTEAFEEHRLLLDRTQAELGDTHHLQASRACGGPDACNEGRIERGSQ